MSKLWKVAKVIDMYLYEQAIKYEVHCLLRFVTVSEFFNLQPPVGRILLGPGTKRRLAKSKLTQNEALAVKLLQQ